MTQTQIEILNTLDMPPLVEELFKKIEIAYDIKPAGASFGGYFINVLKKHYFFLTFEQVESAFERNTNGLLDNYLPRVGKRPDNKITGFNVPDLTKIIKGYCEYKKLGFVKEKFNEIWNPVGKRFEPGGAKIFSPDEKHRIYNDWIDRLIENYEKYKSTGECSHIFTPYFTAFTLSKVQLIDESCITIPNQKKDSDRAGKLRRVKFSSFEDSENVDLIYKCFDGLISSGEDFESKFKYLRNKYG